MLWTRGTDRKEITLYLRRYDYQGTHERKDIRIDHGRKVYSSVGPRTTDSQGVYQHYGTLVTTARASVMMHRACVLMCTLLALLFSDSAGSD